MRLSPDAILLGLRLMDRGAPPNRPPHTAASTMRRLKREARAATCVAHENVVPLLDAEDLADFTPTEPADA